jgi:hypothetical protein
MNDGSLLVASVKSPAGIATIFFATVLKREIQHPHDVEVSHANAATRHTQIHVEFSLPIQHCEQREQAGTPPPRGKYLSTHCT